MVLSTIYTKAETDYLLQKLESESVSNIQGLQTALTKKINIGLDTVVNFKNMFPYQIDKRFKGKSEYKSENM